MLLLPQLLLLTMIAGDMVTTPRAWAAGPDIRGPGRILIKAKSHVSPAQLEVLHETAGAELLWRFPGLGDVQVLRCRPGRDVRDVLRGYRVSALLEYAEPDYPIQLSGLFPDDPQFMNGIQWGLNNAGQAGGRADADIDAPEAWDARHSASNVIVAIVDTGIRTTHEDLGGNVWTHPQLGGHGFNALDGSSNVNDLNGHGTRVAGIIGAVGNNGLGITGVAWQVRLLACKFADSFGGGTVADAIACLDFARTNGALVVNASWGLDQFSLALSNAIAALREAGIMVVASAGNNSRDIDSFPRYPASFNLDNVIAVTATTRQDELYLQANVGATNVDLAAPGFEIYTTDAASDSAYAFDLGTSMAVPHVSAAAALLRAAHPSESPAQIIHRLCAAVDPLPDLAGHCLSGGRLNLRKALEVPESAPRLTMLPASEGDGFSLHLAGDPGRFHVVEAGTNLSDWSAATTNLTGFDGFSVVTNEWGTGLPQHFFRARLLP